MYPHDQTPPGIGQPGHAGARRRGVSGSLELVLDKLIDFVLIFVGLYAATALQRCQDRANEKQQYISLLQDFKRELAGNLEQEASIAEDLGPIDQTTPGKNLGPMADTFVRFFAALAKDEKIVQCLHDEFAAAMPGSPGIVTEECHALYRQSDAAHQEKDAAESFSFKPAVLTPFYRYEVWELYIADGVKTFRNKALAVRIAEVYANARLVEEQIHDIETTYNDAFMTQVGRSAATDMELAEIVHDEETHHGLSEYGLVLLTHVDEAIKEEHYASLEVQRILELKTERMKSIVLLMRAEIEAVEQEIDEELARIDR
jgi:hypothetical protein